MKVAFVYIDPSYRVMGPFHVGIASLIAYLRRAGYDCEFFHLLGDTDEADYIDFLERSKPDVVAFSVMTNISPHLPPIARLTKRHSRALTVCGGVHPTLSPEEVISVDGIDALCIGEGEEALLALCENLSSGKDISGIANLWVKEGEKVHRNPMRPLICDLDTLPFMDREVFPYEESFDLGFMRRGVFMASRGCPYNCAYCCNHAIKQLYGGKRYIRFRSVDNLIEEVETVVRNFPQMDYVVFHDDLLPMKKDWFEEFATEYRRRVEKPFEMNCHPNLMDRDVALMARSAGCRLVRFGIESGNDHIRREVLDRHTRKERIIEAFSVCNEIGIETLSYNMIGLPFEGRSQILDTIKLNARVRPAVMHVSIFYPFPKTKAYAICEREGFLTDRHFDSFFESTILKQDGITPEQIQFLHRHFDPLVKLYSRCYSLPKVLGKIGEKLVDSMVLAVTSRPLLRAVSWVARWRGGERQDSGPCYTIEHGEVRMWRGD